MNSWRCMHGPGSRWPMPLLFPFIFLRGLIYSNRLTAPPIALTPSTSIGQPPEASHSNAVAPASMSTKGGHHGFGGGGGGGGGGFRPRPPSRRRLGDRHRLLQQELAREAKEVQLLESRLARMRGLDHTGGDGTGGDTYTPMPPTSKAPLVDDGRDRQPRAMPPSPLPDSPAFDDSRVVPVVAPLPIRAHESAPTTRSHAIAAAAATEAPALRPGHVPLSSLPVEGVAAVLRHTGLQLYVDAFAQLAVDGEMLAVRACWCGGCTAQPNRSIDGVQLSNVPPSIHTPKTKRTPRCTRRTWSSWASPSASTAAGCSRSWPTSDGTASPPRRCC